MRAILLPLLLGVPSWNDGAFGSWKMNPGRSTLVAPQPRSLIVRIEPHAKGEVLTLEKIERDGSMTSDSTILYLDGRLRDFQDPG